MVKYSATYEKLMPLWQSLRNGQETKVLVLVCLVFFFFNSWDAHRAMNLCILGFFSVVFTGER